MSNKIFHCIVDDTALITNISEIEQWITRSAITLVIPLHTIERLHLLKKDTSQIGQNARKAVRFLDDITSDAKLAATVVIQESEEKYATWTEVEAHYIENVEGKINDLLLVDGSFEKDEKEAMTETSTKTLLDNSEMLKEPNASPASTPPLSPSSSGPQSSKTSPEVKNATMSTGDTSPVPPSLKDLINSVVWYTHVKAKEDLIFLTNSSDTSYLARDFGVTSKNIHQLRALVGTEEQETKDQDNHQKKHVAQADSEPRTLFRYEDAESSEEEVVFQPRGRGASRSATVRGNGTIRSKNGHSPANSLSAQVSIKPQIPIEEIDPDSFDRGSFGRGNTPLASTGPHAANQFQVSRGSTVRGNFTTGGQSRGNYRGGRGGGMDRGSQRGRGRLFVP